MTHTIRTASLIGVCLCLISMAACSTSTPTSTPTLDLDPFRTEVAATVWAQVTQTLSLAPTATSIPSLAATPSVPSTPTQAASASPSPGATSPGGTPQSTLENRGEWVAQSIADGTRFAPAETFTITWTLKNVGVSTWTATYMLRYYSGEPFAAPKEVLLGQVVPPGDVVEVSVPMKTPVRPGDYRTDWVLADENRGNFNEPVFLKITVGQPPTPTATLPGATSTSAPTATAPAATSTSAP